MRHDVRLTAHFFLSQLTASPQAGRSGMRNEPLAEQVGNLRRLAQSLEVARACLHSAQIHVLRAFRRDSSELAAHEGRSAEFIAPDFGTPRDICAYLIAQGFVFDRLVNCDQWVQLDVPKFGKAPDLKLQTGVFEHGRPMRYLEGLV